MKKNTPPQHDPLKKSVEEARDYLRGKHDKKLCAPPPKPRAPFQPSPHIERFARKHGIAQMHLAGARSDKDCHQFILWHRALAESLPSFEEVMA